MKYIKQNKNIVFRTKYKNSAINILNLTECWIHNQTRPGRVSMRSKSIVFHLWKQKDRVK